MDFVEILKKVNIFNGLRDSEVAQIATHFELISLPANQPVIEEGAEGDFFFVIASGEIEINKGLEDIQTQTTPLKMLGPFEYFGEMALIDQFPRSASAVTRKNSTLLRMDKDNFTQLCTTYPLLLFNLIRSLSFRLRDSNQRFIEVVENIIRKNKLAAIGMAASKIIHDIKTPLTVIVLTAQIIQQLHPEAEDFCQDIVKQTKFMDQLVKEILDYAHGKESAINMQRVDFPELLDELYQHCSQISHGKYIKFEFNNTLADPVYLDEMKIKRVLMNLLKNSIEAIFETGTIFLEVEVKKEQLHIRVADTGPGIPEGLQTKIFEPFVTEGKTYGTGLGLAICHKLILDHKGTLTYKNREGGGSQFDIYLPLEIRKPN